MLGAKREIENMRIIGQGDAGARGIGVAAHHFHQPRPRRTGVADADMGGEAFAGAMGEAVEIA